MNLSTHNRNLLGEAKAIQEILSKYVIESVVAGGFCRDVLHNEDAKDIDLCVYNYHSNDGAEQMFREMALNELRELGIRVMELEGIASDGEVATFADHQVERIWMTNIGVDIIFYEDCHPNPTGSYVNFRQGRRVANPRQLVAQFDCNLNQYYWVDEVDQPVFGGLPRHEPENGVYMIRGTRERAGRIEKMSEKAHAFGYHFADPIED